MKAVWHKHTLNFRFTAITSRDRLNLKDTYYIKIYDEKSPDISGIGEAALFRGLSCDDRPDYESVLTRICSDINRYAKDLPSIADYPSIRFGIETALLDLANGGTHRIFDTGWSNGSETIQINGLIWMGDKASMRKRIETKIADDFKCIKIKIGGIDFNEELRLLEYLRDIAPSIEIRLDANGAFDADTALRQLDALAKSGIHSIEQPIKQGQWKQMAEICANSPIPVALDEELIGINQAPLQEQMLDIIKPSYIILKPTLTGGLEASNRWIRLAVERGIGWWATSALESNIGLNAIAQWVSTHHTDMPQGLGTGQLYDNNIPSPLILKGDRLYYDQTKQWDTSAATAF